MSDMSNFDHNALVAAAESNIASEGGTPAPEPVVEPTAPAQVEPNAPTAPTESVTDASVDEFEGLPQELIERFNEQKAQMNKDYTQKNQVIAEQRKQFEVLLESGFTPQDAVNAIQVLQRLDTDQDFQAEFLTRLQSHLGERGIGESPQLDHADYEEDDDTEYIPPSLQQKLAEYDARFAQMQAKEQEMFYANQIHSQEMALRDTYKYSQEELDHIKHLGFSTQGDLIKANEIYLEQQKYWAQKYLTNKQAAAAGVPDIPPATLPQGEAPEQITNIRDAGKISLEQLRAAMAAD